MKKMTEQSMSDWIAEVRLFAQCLHCLEVTIEDEDIILALTMGISHVYDMFIVTLDATPADQLDLHTVISRLLNKEFCHIIIAAAEEEKQEEATVTAALKPATPESKLLHITCYNCGNKEHYQANCPHLRTEVAEVAFTQAAMAMRTTSIIAASAFVEPVPSTARIVEIDEGW